MVPSKHAECHGRLRLMLEDKKQLSQKQYRCIKFAWVEEGELLYIVPFSQYVNVAPNKRSRFRIIIEDCFFPF